METEEVKWYVFPNQFIPVQFTGGFVGFSTFDEAILFCHHAIEKEDITTEIREYFMRRLNETIIEHDIKQREIKVDENCLSDLLIFKKYFEEQLTMPSILSVSKTEATIRERLLIINKKIDEYYNQIIEDKVHFINQKEEQQVSPLGIMVVKPPKNIIHSMLANDLRIGNIIETFGTNGNPDGWVEIVATAEHIKTCVCNPFLFRPISISVVWLQRLGGIRLSSRNFRIEVGKPITYMISLYDNNTYCLRIDDTPTLGYYKHVHQLQNLIHSLEGIELKLK